MAGPARIDRTSINIDECTSPIILGSFLGISEAMVHKERQKGNLPQNTDVPLVDAVQFYIKRLKNKATDKSGDISEQIAMAKMRLDYARTETLYLDQQIKRKEFVEIKELAELMEPIFHYVMSGLHNLARDYPAITDKVTGLTKTWQRLGTIICEKANMDGESFVYDMLNKDIEKVEEKLNEEYGI